MLCQFIFKNFKSYRDESIIDLQATVVKEHSGSLLTYENDKKVFLPVSVIYGPNAGGKSGVVEALATLISTVMKPIDFFRKEPQQLLSSRHYNCPPFLFNTSAISNPTEFLIYFRYKGNEFRYAISLTEGNVFSESLYRRNIGGKVSACIFERSTVDIRFGASMKKGYDTIHCKADTPYITYLSLNYDIEVINSAIEWFSKCICVLNDSMPSSAGIASNVMMLIPRQKEDLLKILYEIDIPLSDINISYSKNARSGEDIAETILLSRIISGDEYILDISDESHGTFKLLNFLPFALIALSEGRLLIVDELDASLHPKLLRYIIKLFKNKDINSKRAQLIFTSHDVTTMKSDIFRRDEIWFAAKDDEGASDIYSLFEIRNEDGSHIKSTAPYDKQYMEGRYGADPYLSEMLNLKWGND